MRRKVFTGIFLTLFLASTLTLTFNIQPSVAEPSVIARASAIPVSAEQLVWSDEFSGSTIGPDWEHMIGDGTLYGLPAGWGNNELQYYTASPENSYVSGGCLHIVARKNHLGHSYTSARLRTKNRQDFLYGKIEARMKLPTTKGMWPAFWMMPTDEVYGGWAASGEIDVMEAFVTDFPKEIVGSIHYGGQWPNNEHQSYSYSGPGPGQTDFSEDFHIYTLEWEPNEFHWYVDGNLYGTTTSWWSSGGDYPAPFDQYFHILVNLAIGGDPVPPPDESTVFPQELVIDYIRVYQVASTPATIVIDGDLSDWADVTPAATDSNGDTFPWSKNATILGHPNSSTRETGNIVLNDKARDLTALYLEVSDNNWVYFRIDFNDIYPGFSNYTMSQPPPNLGNISVWTVYFDFDQLNTTAGWPNYDGGQLGASASGELNFPNGTGWECYVEGCEAYAILTYKDWGTWAFANKTVGQDQIKYAYNYTANAVEVAVNRGLLVNANGGNPLGRTGVTVTTYKKGETWGDFGAGWQRAFDPQAPGLSGEDGGGWDQRAIGWGWPPACSGGFGPTPSQANAPANAPGSGPPPGGYPGPGGSIPGIGAAFTGPSFGDPTTADVADILDGGAGLASFTYTGGLDTLIYPGPGHFKVDMSLGPKAIFTYSPTTPIPGETVTFNASESLGGWNGTHNVPIVSYEWDFGDGTNDASMVVYHNFTAEGAYTVTLNVTDSQGLWNIMSKTITVGMSFKDKLVVLPWVAYAPTHYTPPNDPPLNEIRTDLQVLYDTGFLGVITYSSGGTFADVPRIAKEEGFQGVIMGVWSPTSTLEKENAKSMVEYVDGYCVGNEGLYFGYYNLATLEGAIDELREDTSKPVTTTEPIGYYSDSSLRGIGDWLFPNVHPYWAGEKEPTAAKDWTVGQFNWLRSLEPEKPILFKEVGLPTADDPECSETRQAEYYRLLQRTTVPFAFFEAFDQPWKHEYIDGFDVGPHWGLFESDRSPKEVVSYLGRGGVYPSDGQGNVKNTFSLSEEVYVKGEGFPINTEVDIYLIPDGASFAPNNSKASASQTTHGSGTLPITFIWKANETSNLDIWIDVGQNGIRDKFDIINNETVNTYPINVSTVNASFTLTTLYKVSLHVNGTFALGDNLTVRFYTYSGIYQAESTVWSGTTPAHVVLSMNVSHPLNLPIEYATLVLTDSYGNTLQTITSFLVRRSHLFTRITQIVARWPFAPSAERIQLFNEIVGISKQWPYAPP